MKIAYYILNKLKSKGADEAVIRINKTKAFQIKFSDNKVVKTGSEVLMNLSIFMVKDKKIIVTTVKDFNRVEERTIPETNLEHFDKKNADRVINNLIKFSRSIKPNNNYFGIAEGPFKYKETKESYDKKVVDVDEVDLMNKGINAALENANRTNGIIEKHIINNFLITSNNVDAEDKSTGLYFSIRAFADKEASGHMNSCSRILKKFDVFNNKIIFNFFGYIKGNIFNCFRLNGF